MPNNFKTKTKTKSKTSSSCIVCLYRRPDCSPCVVKSLPPELYFRCDVPKDTIDSNYIRYLICSYLKEFHEYEFLKRGLLEKETRNWELGNIDEIYDYEEQPD